MKTKKNLNNPYDCVGCIYPPNRIIRNTFEKIGRSIKKAYEKNINK